MRRVLSFLNLLDESRNLSLTNIALVALVVKMLLATNLDWPSTVTLVTVFANYMHKRQQANALTESSAAEDMAKITADYRATVQKQEDTIADLATRISTLKGSFNLSNLVKKP